jgi:hypothetical protein
MTTKEITADFVELSATDGKAFIEKATPLTRLHYFDGKYLRADALTLEQDYHRQRTRLGNIAGGWGAVNGLGISLSGNELDVEPGLAITAAGNFVLATSAMHAAIDDLLKVAAPAPPAGSAEFAACLEKQKAGVTETAALAIYEITVGPVDGLCGNEPVYGKLCETACASDSQHPYWREGVVLRLRPITLQLPTSTSVTAALVHLRNRIASAYFKAEPWLTPSALSAAGLASGVWCQPATLYGRDEVVIGLLAREGGVNRVIDAWSGRRERMDTQARGYWQGRMAMRPWNVFVAQILQFQCQLSGLFQPGKPVIKAGDDCDHLRTLLTGARKQMELLVKRYAESSRKILAPEKGRATGREMRAMAGDMDASIADFGELASKLAEAELGKGALPKQRMLLEAGFFELPPAGYLPVDPQIAIEEQVQRMFGQGVHLDFRAVRGDEIAHLVEQAQHMERISLTRGLDDAKSIEQVEIFVPDGEVRSADAAASGTWWRLDMSLDALAAVNLVLSDKDLAPAFKLGTSFDGLVRTERRDDGSAGFALVADTDLLQEGDGPRLSIYLSTDIGTDPFALPVGGETTVKSERVVAKDGKATTQRIVGTLTVLSRHVLPSGVEERQVQLELTRTPPPPLGTPAPSVRVILQRDGDADSGIFILDDGQRDPQTSPVFFQWDDAPRHAIMFINAADPANTIFKGKLDGLPAGEGSPAPQAGRKSRQTAAAAAATPAATLATRQQLLAMTALSAMPGLTTALGAAAMNTLSSLADALADAAFLARARNRLFPTLEAPKAQTVRALRDWVMFRRARTLLCCPPETQAPSDLESFQAWHIELDDKDQMTKLQEGLAKNDGTILDGFDFKRVGILRYRDDNVSPEESHDHVLAMWTAAKPAAEVTLGRIWETPPTPAQGLQNQSRLRDMLDQIATLTKPPAPGSNVLATMKPPAGKLADAAFDGGMLVVTTKAAAPVQTRKALLIFASQDNGQHFPANPAPHADAEFVNDAPKDDAIVTFVKGLSANQPVNGVTLATTKGAPDAGAQQRVNAVVEAVRKAGRPAPRSQKTLALSDPDRGRLTGLGLKPETYDDVIFFEPNPAP